MTWLDGYQQVGDRLREFWSDHPDGRCITELVTPKAAEPGDVIVFKALVQRDARVQVDVSAFGGPPESLPGDEYRGLVPDATGYAHQRILAEPPKLVNKRTGEVKVNDTAPEWTSPWEVAETSAVGRALANLGYAPKGQRPSREEMSKAQASGGGAAVGTDSRPSGEAVQASAKADRPLESPLPDTDGGSGGEGDADAGTADTPPPARHYSVDPGACTHRYPSGNWLPWDDEDRCPKCGTPKVTAVEGTTADLGSA